MVLVLCLKWRSLFLLPRSQSLDFVSPASDDFWSGNCITVLVVMVIALAEGEVSASLSVSDFLITLDSGDDVLEARSNQETLTNRIKPEDQKPNNKCQKTPPLMQPGKICPFLI